MQLKIKENKGLKDSKLKIKRYQNNLKRSDNQKFQKEKQDSEMMQKLSLKKVLSNFHQMITNQTRKNRLVENKVNSTNKTALKTNKAVKKALEKINKILKINKRSEIKFELIVITLIVIL